MNNLGKLLLKNNSLKFINLLGNCIDDDGILEFLQ